MKKTTFILASLLSCLLTSYQLYAQAPNWSWAKRAGGSSVDGGNGISVDAAGNSYVTGYFRGTATFGSITLTSAGDYDIFVAKYDTNGNVLWAKKAGGSSGDGGYGISVDAAGNSYVTGVFSGTATFGSGIILTSADSGDIFVAKYDANGNVLWAKRAGGSGSDEGIGISVDTAGNSYVTGVFSGTATFGSFTLTSAGNYDIFVAKYAANGNVLWAKKAGGSYYDYSNGISVDAAGNSYVTGYFVGTVTFGSSTLNSAGWLDIFVAKYDANGNVLWAKKAGGSDFDGGRSISVDAAGNSYVTGFFRGTATFGSGIILTGAGNYDVFVAKYDANGNVLWAKKAGGGSDDGGGSISVDAAGNSYVTGGFSDAATFGDSTLTSAGVTDIFVAKYDANGNVLWAKQAGGSSDDYASGISIDAAGNSYVTGYFGDTATFGSITLNSAGLSDVFVAKLGNAPIIASTVAKQVKTATAVNIFPNPNNGTFSVQGENIQNLTVLDVTGKVVFTQKVNKENLTNINLQNATKGVYLVRILTSNGITTKKIVVE